MYENEYPISKQLDARIPISSQLTESTQDQVILQIQHQLNELKSKADLKDYLDEKFDKSLHTLDQKVTEKLGIESEKAKTGLRILVIIGISSIAGFITMYISIYNAVHDAVQKDLEKKMSTAFNSNKVNASINEYAKKYTETAAQKMIESQVSSELKHFKSEIKKDLSFYKTKINKDLDSSINKVKSLTENVTKIHQKTTKIEANLNLAKENSEKLLSINSSRSDIEQLYSSAKEDSYSAYRTLTVLEKNQNLDKSVKSLTRSKLSELNTNLKELVEAPSSFGSTLTITINGISKELNTLTDTELTQSLHATQITPMMRVYIKHTLQKRPEIEILTVSLNVFNSGISLSSCALVRKILSNKYNVNFPLEDQQVWIQWLQQKILNLKPITQ